MASKSAQKDQEMAARMKRDGVTRTTGRCPICHDVVGNNGGHLLQCRGPHRKGSSGTNAGVIKPG